MTCRDSAQGGKKSAETIPMVGDNLMGKDIKNLFARDTGGEMELSVVKEQNKLLKKIMQSKKCPEKKRKRNDELKSGMIK